MTVLYVAMGGAVGASLRYGVGLVAKRWLPDLPLGTLLVNLAGCLMIGVLAGAWAQGTTLSRGAQTGVLVGFLGGLTTFSSFGLESVTLLQGEQWVWAATNVLGQVVLGLGLVLLGLRLGTAM